MPKISTEIIENICENIRIGATQKHAAIAAGITETSFYNWKEKGEKDIKNGKKSVYVEFLESLSKANSEAMVYHVTKLAISKDPRSSMFILERRFPDEFGRKDKIKHEGEFKHGHVHDFKDSPERIANVIKILQDINQRKSGT